MSSKFHSQETCLNQFVQARASWAFSWFAGLEYRITWVSSLVSFSSYTMVRSPVRGDISRPKFVDYLPYRRKTWYKYFYTTLISVTLLTAKYFVLIDTLLLLSVCKVLQVACKVEKKNLQNNQSRNKYISLSYKLDKNTCSNKYIKEIHKDLIIYKHASKTKQHCKRNSLSLKFSF